MFKLAKYFKQDSVDISCKEYATVLQHKENIMNKHTGNCTHRFLSSLVLAAACRSSQLWGQQFHLGHMQFPGLLTASRHTCLDPTKCSKQNKCVVLFCGMLHYVGLVKTDISEESVASIFIVERICEQGAA